MCDPVTTTAIMAIGTAASIVQGQQQQSAAKKAASQQQANAEKMYTMQEQEQNRLNAKKPNVAAMMSANLDNASSTSLTGPTGVDPSSLFLSKTSALGA